MKIPSLLALAGSAISFAVPAMAQQKDAAISATDARRLPRTIMCTVPHALLHRRMRFW